MDATLPIIIAVTIVLLTSIVMLVYMMRRRGLKGKVICLIGLTDAGKTLMFMRLAGAPYVRTQTSMKENRGNYRVKMKDGKDKDVELVDIPGDERISLRSFKQSIDTLMGLILVVDSVNFPHESRDLCHLIIDIMSDVKVYRKRFPMLIACNKQDMVLACSIDNIRDKLESEITLILTSESVKLSSIDKGKRGEDRGEIQLIPDGCESFKFPTGVVEFVYCSAKGRGGDEKNCTPEINHVKHWIESIC